ncbi:MAG: permease-like cell division protein FtsX [Gemmatimonadetes bacterium]|nr:permease-like cell division protein FtsX [Gemmatimonadota bacterium]
MTLATREALLAFRRAPMLSALSVTTIAFSLFAFGLFGLVALNIREALSKLEDRVEIRAFVGDGTAIESSAAALGDIQAFPEVATAALGDIQAFPEVATAALVTPTQALERARSELGEFSDVFDAGILPASIDVRLKPGFRDPASVRAVAARIRSYEFIEDVRFGEEWVEKLYQIRNVATIAGTVLGLTFALVAVIIIGSTIRMAVLARAREISIMRLVGATDSFVRRPFLIEGALKGAMGGTVALFLTWATNEIIGRVVFSAEFFDVRLSVAGIFAGALIGLVGSAVSVGRHLKSV